MIRPLVTLIAAALLSALLIGVVLAEPMLPPNVEFVATRGAFSKYQTQASLPVLRGENGLRHP
jgi:hypothetical protein